MELPMLIQYIFQGEVSRVLDARFIDDGLGLGIVVDDILNRGIAEAARNNDAAPRVGLHIADGNSVGIPQRRDASPGGILVANFNRACRAAGLRGFIGDPIQGDVVDFRPLGIEEAYQLAAPR